MWLNEFPPATSVLSHISTVHDRDALEPLTAQGTPLLVGGRYHRQVFSCAGTAADDNSTKLPRHVATMDPYSAEGELINIHNHFHQGQYQEVVDFDTSSFSPENALPAKVLVLRARIALGQAKEVLAEVKGQKEPELEAVGALAEQTLGNEEAAVKTVEALASSSADNVAVQIIGGTVLQAAGKSEDALALLTQHQGSCEFNRIHLRTECTETNHLMEQWTPLP